MVSRLYRHGKDVNRIQHSDGTVTHTSYSRLLILSSLDILLTLPFGIVNLVLNVIADLSQGGLPFYSGWENTHSDWEPMATSYAEIREVGTSYIASQYFVYWTSPVLALAIFGLFGITSEARASYWRIICAAGAKFGWAPAPRTSLEEIEFCERLPDLEFGYVVRF